MAEERQDPNAAEAAKADAAQAAADQWLEAIDRGDAPATHAAAAALFRAAITPEKWAESMQQAQLPIGRAVARSVHSRRYARELPGAPDGEYVLVEYATEFERKKNGVETVVMMLEPAGDWRVSGYWIR